MQQLITWLVLATALAGPAYANTHKEAPNMQGGASCDAKATEKKLAGAAKASFMKKCESDMKGGMATAGDGPCDKQAQEKKLAGAAKTAFVKKCKADAKA